MIEAKPLSHLLVMQTMLINLPDSDSIMSFVCHGLIDIPGIKEARYDYPARTQCAENEVLIQLEIGSSNFGALVLVISDFDIFNEYHNYVTNFALTLAVILEERSQRRIILKHQTELEDRIAERTKELQEEIRHRRLIEESLRESEFRYRNLFSESPVAIWEQSYREVKQEIDILRNSGITDIPRYLKANPPFVKSLVGRVKIIDANKSAAVLFDCENKDNFTDFNIIFPDSLQLNFFIDQLQLFSEQQLSFECEMTITTCSGKKKVTALRQLIVPEHAETWEKVILTMIDITELKKAEESVLQKSRELEMFFSTSLDLLCIADMNGNFVRLNKQWSTLLDYALDELESHTYLDFVHPDDLDMTYKAMEEIKKAETVIALTNRYRCRDGSYRWIEWHAISAENLIYATARDITDRKIYEDNIKKALREKELLLQELYHRTKNNMQVISALIELKASTFDDEKSKSAFLEIKSKVYAMSLVHQKLYEAKDLSKISLKNYLQDLSDMLKRSYQSLNNRVTFTIDVPENFSMLIDTAIPIAMIFNELITNSFKHAFPDNRNGIIIIGASKNESGEIILRYGDNGIGTQDGFDVHKNSKLGMSTVIAIVEKQLLGRIEREKGEGTAFTITFMDNQYFERV